MGLVRVAYAAVATWIVVADVAATIDFEVGMATDFVAGATEIVVVVAIENAEAVANDFDWAAAIGTALVAEAAMHSDAADMKSFPYYLVVVEVVVAAERLAVDPEVLDESVLVSVYAVPCLLVVLEGQVLEQLVLLVLQGRLRLFVDSMRS